MLLILNEADELKKVFLELFANSNVMALYNPTTSYMWRN